MIRDSTIRIRVINEKRGPIGARLRIRGWRQTPLGVASPVTEPNTDPVRVSRW